MPVIFSRVILENVVLKCCFLFYRKLPSLRIHNFYYYVDRTFCLLLPMPAIWRRRVVVIQDEEVRCVGKISLMTALLRGGVVNEVIT